MASGQGAVYQSRIDGERWQICRSDARGERDSISEAALCRPCEGRVTAGYKEYGWTSVSESAMSPHL
jgi:hypothetical protein